MINVDEQYEQLRSGVVALHGEIAATELDNAFTIAEHVHKGELRKSGDPYITHPVTVAQYAADWRLRPSCIRAALLHDLPYSVDLKLYEDAIGPTVAAYVRALSGLKNTGTDALDITSSFDRNVAALKVADRLHNARTWDYIPLKNAHAQHTLTVVAPLAAAMNISGVADELRALSIAKLAQLSRAEEGRRGVAGSFLAGALRMLPPEHYDRYRDEWLADLAQVTSRRERAALATGLIYSAWAIRRSQ